MLRSSNVLSGSGDYFGLFRAYTRKRHRPRRRLLDVAPVADILLITILFYLLSASFVIQPGITLTLPVAPFEGGASYASLVVTVTQEGMVFFDDERTPLEGLAAAFAQAVHEQPDAQLLVEADARVEHGTLVEIYNMAVGAGIEKVTLAARVPERSTKSP